MNTVRKIIFGLFYLIFFPFIRLWLTWYKGEGLLRKIVYTFLIIFILIPLWLFAGFTATATIGGSSMFLGLTKITIPTVGPSMLPTLSEHDKIAIRKNLDFPYFQYKPQRGDIVVFSNETVKEYLETARYLNNEEKRGSGLVKRVIGLPGDTVTIKDGFVYLNGKILEEPYTLKSHSTFGGKLLKECHDTKVPEGDVLVFGDNRKQSADSRHLGFVALSDIEFYLPLAEQEQYKTRWRDASHDKEDVQKSSLDIQKYLDLLNQKRKAAGVKLLKYQPKLTLSAQKRAEVMVKFNDFSYEATKSGYTMVNAMEDVDYSNIVWGEVPAVGYYEADELTNYFFEFPKEEKFLLNSDFEETGISAIVQNLNGCPTQVIVQHLAGYKPPNYKKEEMDSWKSNLNNINAVVPSWELARQNPDLNQKDVETLLNLLYRERTIASTILSKMEANQWLTKQEQNWIKEFSELSKQSGDLAEKLNQQGRNKAKQGWDNYLDSCIKAYETLEKESQKSYETEKQKCRDNYNANAPK